MTELLTAAQMRAIETAAIESGEVTGLELMERAGRGVVEAVFEEWPELAKTSHRAVVLCGPGNNGGDGFVVARLLREWGWEVEVSLYGDADKLPPDARVNYERWVVMGEVHPLSSGFEPTLNDDSDLLVDALFGTGMTRPLEGLELTLLDLQEAVSMGINCNTYRCGVSARVVAIDLPSGICSDSGVGLRTSSFVGLPDVAAANHARADITVSFHAPKLGHFLETGPWASDSIIVKSIGLEGSPRPRVGVKPPPRGAVGGCPAVPPGEVVQLLEPPFCGLPKHSGHKFSHGHGLVLTGGAGKTGAARLAARGALRIGAGLVTLGVPGNAQMEVAGQITALMLTRVEDGDGLAEVLQDPRITALCLGPGMGVERAAALLPAALDGGLDTHPTRSVVLDADALTALSQDKALFDMLHANCILTPHAGEFARLFPDISEKLNATPTKGPAYSKVDATREAARRAGCIVLFKGPDTVIAAPDGRCAINSAHYERAAPWLATAGSGDVLAGFITGLLARGLPPMQAAETAAWLHVECARSFGPGLIAEDISEELPKVFRALGVA